MLCGYNPLVSRPSKPLPITLIFFFFFGVPGSVLSLNYPTARVFLSPLIETFNLFLYSMWNQKEWARLDSQVKLWALPSSTIRLTYRHGRRASPSARVNPSLSSWLASHLLRMLWLLGTFPSPTTIYLLLSILKDGPESIMFLGIIKCHFFLILPFLSPKPCTLKLPCI